MSSWGTYHLDDLYALASHDPSAFVISWSSLPENSGEMTSPRGALPLMISGTPCRGCASLPYPDQTAIWAAQSATPRRQRSIIRVDD